MESKKHVHSFDYLVSLKENNNNAADIVSQLLYLFSIINFGYFIYNNPSNSLPIIVVVVVLLIVWIITLVYKRKNGYALFRYGLFIASTGWIVGNEKNILFFVLYFIAAILEKQVKMKPTVGFTKERITFNILPKKTIMWQDVSNVVLKDGLLTIDQKNNKLYQKEIEDIFTAEVESAFNEFCKQQIDNQIV